MKRILTLSVILALLAGPKAWADDWMAALPNTAYVTQLSIPGTHDSGTGHGFSGFIASTLGYGNKCAKTQDKDIQGQWDSGIRAFDLRPTVDDGSLHIYHGIMKTNVSFKKALQIIRDNVAAHPTEFAFVLMRHESDNDDNDSSWGDKVVSVLSSEEFNGYFIEYKPNMTVGDVRGKILLMSRDNYADTPFGAYIGGWSHDVDYSAQCNGSVYGPNGSTALSTQDIYDTTNGKLVSKQSAIETMLAHSLVEKGQRWYINHTSAYDKTTSILGNDVSSSDGYRDNAANCNSTVINYMSGKAGPMGIVVMDFAGVDESNSYKVRSLELTNLIIQNNFNFKMQGITPVETITFSSGGTRVMKMGGTLRLAYSLKPTTATNKTVEWTSSDESVATVSAAKVTPVAPGVTTITVSATDGSGVSASVKVIVLGNDETPVTELSWSKAYLPSARSGENYDIRYTTTDPTSSNNWLSVSFGASRWEAGFGPVGSEGYEVPAGTAELGTFFEGVYDNEFNLWYRRKFELTENLAGKNVYLACGHDDEGAIYIDGQLIEQWGNQWDDMHYVKLTSEQTALLTEGKHVISVWAKNNTGAFYSDCGLYGDAEYIAPLGSDRIWAARVFRKDAPRLNPDADSGRFTEELDNLEEPEDLWQTTEFNDSKWEWTAMPIGTGGYGMKTYTQWEGEYNTLWIRRDFTITQLNKDSEYYLKVHHDDDYEIYVNGNLLDYADGWTTPGSPEVLKIHNSWLTEGTNVIAARVQQNWGEAYFDCGVYEVKANKRKFLLGDANSDETVTMADANLVVNGFVAESFDKLDKEASDVNTDGNITMADANGIVNIFVNQ